MNLGKKHIIVYSHGFGVRKDGRGLFTDIAAGLPGAEHVMFDYNQADEAANTLTVAPLGEQADKLRQIVAKVRAENPQTTIDLICHSQGCVAAALAQPQGIRKIIFAAPPEVLNTEMMVKAFGSRPGSHVDLEGTSKFSRRDGSTTIVPKVYWSDIKNIQPVALYNDLAKHADELIIVNANQDEVLGSVDFTNLADNIKVTAIDANHDFTNNARGDLIGVIKQELEF